ncbi:MAG: TrmH family RNA methyltransferase [Acutalibacteraceae bacterium]
MEKITSRDNSKIKETSRLASNKRERAERRMFVCEGLRLCADAVSSKAEILSAFFTPDFLKKHPDTAKEVERSAVKSYEITDSLAKKISETETSQGVIIVCRHPDIPLKCKGKLLVLDGVSDPGNIGAIARSAEAFAVDGIIMSADCADPFSPKSLRASMGAFFRIPTKITDSAQTAAKMLKAKGFKVYGSVVDNPDKTVFECDFSGDCAMIIGSEAFGMSQAARKACDYLITLPMKGRAESLNASTAAALLLWEMQK